MWVVRDFVSITFFLQYLLQLCSLVQETDNAPLVIVHVHFTGAKKAQMATVAYNLMLTLFYTSQETRCVKIHIGRPDISQLMGHHNPTGVYYCGAPPLEQVMKDICKKREVPFFPEEFQDRTLATLWGCQKANKKTNTKI